MRRPDKPDRRDHPRRRCDPRARDILLGKCDKPTWSIDRDGHSQVCSPCGLCLPCRVQARLGLLLGAEVKRDLRIRGDRRLLKERRHRSAEVRTERRKPFVRRDNRR